MRDGGYTVESTKIMRVIAGSSGGIPLTVPKSITRPTTDRVREAMFSSLGDLIPDAVVLDLFAGTGALGIESLSRGAASAVFVEENRAACEVIAGNLAKTGLTSAEVRRTEVGSFITRLGTGERFDLIFADPPYARNELQIAGLSALLNLEKLAASLKKDGVFVLETFAREPLPESPLWKVQREKNYGDTRVSFLLRV